MESAGLLDGEDVRDEDQLISIAQHLSDEHFSIDNFKPSVTPAISLQTFPCIYDTFHD